MKPVRLITALGTPLEGEGDDLCIDGLVGQLDDQADARMDGLLIAGTMGATQMLPDRTWQALVRQTSELNGRRFELLVGVTDQSLNRVLDRVSFAERVGKIDGLVALTPWGFGMTEADRVGFYRALADAAKLPVFIYDLQPMTGVTLSLEAVATLSEHPNIAGLKISCNLVKARALRERVKTGFRIIPAEPQLLDVCAASGLWSEHLDGVFAAAPHWSKAVVDQVAAGDFKGAAATQGQINRLLQCWFDTGQVMAAFTATMNARGIPGRYHPRPLSPMSEAARRQLLDSPELQSLLGASREPTAATA